jgi:hypothetical protein
MRQCFGAQIEQCLSAFTGPSVSALTADVVAISRNRAIAVLKSGFAELR